MRLTYEGVKAGGACLRLPDFIIAGAPRSGTGWLCSLLAKHPQIGLAQPIAPEPKFFLVDELYERGLGYYATRWFADTDRAILGEKSTNYLEDPRCAARIAANLPTVRLVFMLRNPVDRAFSNFRWSCKNGLETEDFETALALDGQRIVEPHLRYARPFDYVSRGRYAELLKPYLDLFPRDRILLLNFDDVAAAPRDIATRIHRFLQVGPRPEDIDGLAPVNQTEGASMDTHVRRVLTDYYAKANQNLRDSVGFDISRWA